MQSSPSLLVLLTLTSLALGTIAAPTAASDDKCNAALQTAANSDYAKSFSRDINGVFADDEKTADQRETAIRSLIKNVCAPEAQAPFRQTAKDVVDACTDLISEHAAASTNTTVNPTIRVVGGQLATQTAYFGKDLVCLKSPASGEYCAIENLDLLKKYNLIPGNIPEMLANSNGSSIPTNGTMADFFTMPNSFLTGVTSDDSGNTTLVATNGTTPQIPKEAICTVCNAKTIEQLYVYVNTRIVPLLRLVDPNSANQTVVELQKSVASAKTHCGDQFVNVENAKLELGLLDASDAAASDKQQGAGNTASTVSVSVQVVLAFAVASITTLASGIF